MTRKPVPTRTTPREESNWFELIAAHNQERREIAEHVKKLRSTIQAMAMDPGFTPDEKIKIAEADQRWAVIEQEINRA